MVCRKDKARSMPVGTLPKPLDLVAFCPFPVLFPLEGPAVAGLLRQNLPRRRLNVALIDVEQRAFGRYWVAQ